ncbi:MAG: DUF2510 domain-containing protein [Acidimicrobiales bacterium]
MTQSAPGWHPDPAGRFAQRYHDGSGWTEHVVDAQGGRASDPVDHPVAPPAGFGPPTAAFDAPPNPYGPAPGTYPGPPGAYGSPPAGYGPPPGYGVAVPRGPYGAGPFGPVAPRRGPSTAGLIVAGIGAVLVLLGHLAGLDWVTSVFGNLGIDFADIREFADAADFSDELPIATSYAQFGWLLALLAAGLGVLGAAVRTPFRWIGLGVGIVMTLWCLAASGELAGDDPGLEIGAGAMVAGLGLIMTTVGSALPSPRRA